MDCDKEQHGGLVCESFTCNFRPSRMFDEVWMARQRREETRLVRRGFFRYGKRSGFGAIQ
jgi:hypothetical protein